MLKAGAESFGVRVGGGGRKDRRKRKWLAGRAPLQRRIRASSLMSKSYRR